MLSAFSKGASWTYYAPRGFPFEFQVCPVFQRGSTPRGTVLFRAVACADADDSADDVSVTQLDILKAIARLEPAHGGEMGAWFQARYAAAAGWDDAGRVWGGVIMSLALSPWESGVPPEALAATRGASAWMVWHFGFDEMRVAAGHPDTLHAPLVFHGVLARLRSEARPGVISSTLDQARSYLAGQQHSSAFMGCRPSTGWGAFFHPTRKLLCAR